MRVRPDGLPRAAAGGGGARPAPAARYGNLLFALCDAVAHTIRPPLERIDCGLPRRGRRAPKRTPSGDRRHARWRRVGRGVVERSAMQKATAISFKNIRFISVRGRLRERDYVTIHSWIGSGRRPLSPLGLGLASRLALGRALRSPQGTRAERAAGARRRGQSSEGSESFSFCEILSMLLSRDY